jgi:hypothetical protein
MSTTMIAAAFCVTNAMSSSKALAMRGAAAVG